MAVQQLTLSETQAAIANLWGTDWPTMAAKMSEYGISPAQMANNDFLRQWSGGAVEPIYARNGETILGYNFRADASTVRTGLSSNTSIVARGNVNHAPATVIETVGENAGKVRVSRLSGVGSKVVTAASKLAVPLTLASVGITLGKTIDETLYNANPDFWESIGAGSINPQKWNSIVGGDGTFAGSFFNAIFGIDSNTGETQAYMNADAFAYLSYCLNNAGFFNNNSTQTDFNPSTLDLTRPYISPWPLSIGTGFLGYYNRNSTNGNDRMFTTYGSAPVYIGLLSRSESFPAHRDIVQIFMCSTQPFYYMIDYYAPATGELVTPGTTQTNSIPTVINNVMYYYAVSAANSIDSDFCIPIPNHNPAGQGTNSGNEIDFCKCVFLGTIESGGIEGIGNQPNASLPNFSGLEEDEYLPYLQSAYPNRFNNNAIDYPVVQPDGTVTNYKYIPISLPEITGATSTQPISGNQTQLQPSINPATAPDILTELLTNVLQQPMNQPITDTPTPPGNPTDSGDGSTPPIVAPTGSASSLWKIYHPTQAQIDSFGGWLWSSAFIDQILKIFNDPMQAIIGLHKIYATPIDAGTSTIKVGYLDSQVPSAYVEQQYVDVDCGTIDLYEQFGNVFDYSPYTDVQLYLPFIGIIPLNVSDIMRSSINVTYGVDVLTGACLAIISVNRDSNDVVMYQYSGNCAVQYPISSGSYMGIVSSIISVAGGVAATIASGGGAAPLALGVAGGAMSAHTNVQHSGSFSGNSGAMGGKTPYLIISRPQTKMSYNFDEMEGYPANHYTTIGECSGYVRARTVHVINVPAFDDELDEINSFLMSGIII